MSTATLRFTVTDADTARAMGSGSLPVLGTPRVLAWLEAATCRAIEAELAPGATSVGTRVAVEHQAASAVGQLVEVTAATAYTDGRLRRFSVAARHVGADGTPAKTVATGEITRVIVDGERFLARVPAP
ncbi:thioesterase family protein [Nocardioides insulae]|uniref:thioesterase family protein n=1 Tax=Nocardioides insulae TaxID=394734 RepID=UPI0004239001|nr:thioesterase [Nocardioides insulae]